MKTKLKNTLCAALTCVSLLSFSNNSANAAILKSGTNDPSPEEMKLIFNMIDKDGNGAITLREWNISGFTAYEKVFNNLDADGSGDLNFNEFLVLDYYLLRDLNV
ncbi:hypothetical protein TH53_18105 [Pedobacter lusitanus]|uniref:Contig80, whole genome shotgun sequence n=1 Tax=Pedobacter lusitanus TaxID=1503925 RepID=A0A0D0FTP9_9SPHI|nr:EF-hand domain-containing protein [Pedobacter lusitanus]KIO75814.1 hypothetical protein TH53_18105 [Pedobacter lusitanus]